MDWNGRRLVVLTGGDDYLGVKAGRPRQQKRQSSEQSQTDETAYYFPFGKSETVLLLNFLKPSILPLAGFQLFLNFLFIFGEFLKNHSKS